ncbi:MAG: virulence RhuM family protein [Succinivibrio sp.]|nr:virulence RhuM family protein [Succinivibrio sp.]
MSNAKKTASSTAMLISYLVSAKGDEGKNLDVRYGDENIWLTQKNISELYSVSRTTIGKHLAKIFSDGELSPETSTRNYQVTQYEGKRTISRTVIFYSLEAVIAVGYKVDNQKAVQFRKWATDILKNYAVQGWALDEQRLKNGGKVFGDDYFERLLEKIREIRLSERRFYQKITDVYATAADYDPSSKQTQAFFATVQNKIHFGIHGQTAAETVYTRADANMQNMGLTSWDGYPDGKIHKSDVTIAKNYLSENELHQMQRLVSAFLDLAEDKAKNHTPMMMADWEGFLDRYLQLADKPLLDGKGRVSHDLAVAKAEAEFEKFRVAQDKSYLSDFDRYEQRLLGKVKESQN